MDLLLVGTQLGKVSRVTAREIRCNCSLNLSGSCGAHFDPSDDARGMLYQIDFHVAAQMCAIYGLARNELTAPHFGFDSLLDSLLAFVVNLAEISNGLHSSVLGREIENVGSVEFVNALELPFGEE